MELVASEAANPHKLRIHKQAKIDVLKTKCVPRLDAAA